MYLFAAIDTEVDSAPDYLLLDLDAKAGAFIEHMHAKYLVAVKDDDAILSLKVDVSTIRHCWLRDGDERLDGTALRPVDCGAGKTCLWQTNPGGHYLAEELPEGFDWKSSAPNADYDWIFDFEMSVGDNVAHFSGSAIHAGSFQIGDLALWSHTKTAISCPLCGAELGVFTWYCKELKAEQIEVSLDDEGLPVFVWVETEDGEDDEYQLCLCPHCNQEFRPEEIGLTPTQVEW